MSRSIVPTFAPLDAEGRPLARFGPEHIASTDYLRRNVAVALNLPQEEQAKFWKARRAFVARRLFECGFDADEVSAALKAFNDRARREAEVRRVLMRVEAETAADGGDP